MTIDLRLEGSNFKLSLHSKTISTVHFDQTAGSCNCVTQLQHGIQIVRILLIIQMVPLIPKVKVENALT
ncbi:hypothetical protein MTR_7g016030 [Medicago truncatula]|uniref:Uncharacterized protein n=1 Tax=Medicago truncatula TaxID=3880 RepID=A0A072U7D5_MEDTR|nr:hypothetical protein MTR_7g016030 [Medicago truncatula]